MRSHVMWLAQLVTRAPGLCLHGHVYRTAPAGLGQAQTLCNSALLSSSHRSSSAELPCSSLSDHHGSSNDSCQPQATSQGQQLQCQQQLQPQHYSLRSSMMGRLASVHSSHRRSRHQSHNAAQLGQSLLSQFRAFHHQPTPLAKHHAIAAAAHVHHVTTVSPQQLRRGHQHAQRLLSNSLASCSGRVASTQPRAPFSMCEETRQFSALADVGQNQNPDLQKPSFQRAPPQRPHVNQQRPSNGPAQQRRPNLGPSSSLDSQTPLGPIYRNPKRNPKAPEEPQSKRLKANREITAAEVRLVGDDGQHQVMSLTAALKAAQDAKLDLVQVAGGAVPPVCRLLNHSKVSYEAKVKERQLEKKQNENRRVSLIKEVHFGAHTAEHDMQVKVKKAREFLQKGHRVKCTLRHKPVRGQGQRDALKALPALQERMAEFAEVSPPPATEKQSANMLSFYLAPLAEQKQA